MDTKKYETESFAQIVYNDFKADEKDKKEQKKMKEEGGEEWKKYIDDRMKKNGKTYSELVDEMEKRGWQKLPVSIDWAGRLYKMDKAPKLSQSQYDVNDGFYINSKTGFAAGAFVNEARKEIIIAYRGTNEITDWTRSNRDILFKKIPEQIVDATKFYGLIKNSIKYKGYKITVTGQSLGGTLAMIIGAYTGEEAYTYNPAGITQIHELFDNEKGIIKLSRDKKYENVKNFVIENDILKKAGDKAGYKNIGTTYILKGTDESSIDAHNNHEALKKQPTIQTILEDNSYNNGYNIAAGYVKFLNKILKNTNYLNSILKLKHNINIREMYRDKEFVQTIFNMMNKKTENAQPRPFFNVQEPDYTSFPDNRIIETVAQKEKEEEPKQPPKPRSREMTDERFNKIAEGIVREIVRASKNRSIASYEYFKDRG